MTWIWWLIIACVCIMIGLLVHEVLHDKKPPYDPSKGNGE